MRTKILFSILLLTILCSSCQQKPNEPTYASSVPHESSEQNTVKPTTSGPQGGDVGNGGGRIAMQFSTLINEYLRTYISQPDLEFSSSIDLVTSVHMVMKNTKVFSRRQTLCAGQQTECPAEDILIVKNYPSEEMMTISSDLWNLLNLQGKLKEAIRAALQLCDFLQPGLEEIREDYPHTPPTDYGLLYDPTIINQTVQRLSNQLEKELDDLTEIDDIVANFKYLAQEGYQDIVKMGNLPAQKLESLKKSIQQSNIKVVTSKLCLDKTNFCPQEEGLVAKNYPQFDLIAVNQFKWNKQSYIERKRFAIHEHMGLIGLEKGTYSHSSDIIGQ